MTLSTGRAALLYQEVEDTGTESPHRRADIVISMDPMARESRPAPIDPGDTLTSQLLAVAKRDRPAFEAIYAATVDRVLGLAARIVGDTSTADDVASDVYLQVWRHADRFDPSRGSAIAWIMTITRSRSLDTVRRITTSASKSAELERETPNADADASAHDLLQATDQKSAVHRALLQLDSAERQLLALAYFRGYSHVELAGITGQPLGTVKTQIRRTLIKLRKLMTDDCRDAGEST